MKKCERNSFNCEQKLIFWCLIHPICLVFKKIWDVFLFTPYFKAAKVESFEQNEKYQTIDLSLASIFSAKRICGCAAMLILVLSIVWGSLGKLLPRSNNSRVCHFDFKELTLSFPQSSIQPSLRKLNREFQWDTLFFRRFLKEILHFIPHTVFYEVTGTYIDRKKRKKKATSMETWVMWPRHPGPGCKPRVCARDQRPLSFIFLRTPVLDSEVCRDLRCHGESASGSEAETVGLRCCDWQTDSLF